MRKSHSVSSVRTAEVTDLTHDGRGVGRCAGLVCFIEGALPGERVQWKQTSKRSRYLEGQLIQVLDASPDRIDPACPVHDRCGGCQLQHLTYPAQLQAKQRRLESDFSHAGVVVERWHSPQASQPLGYRRRTRLAVDYPRDAAVRVGFRERASSRVLALDHCPVLVPDLDCLLADLPSLLASCDGRVEEVELVVDESSLSAVLTGSVTALSGVDLGAFERASLFIRDSDSHVCRQVAGPPLPLGPPGFIQANAEVNSAVRVTALEWLQPEIEDRILDAFCGAGNFSLPLAARVARVTGLELSSALVERGQAAAHSAGLTNVGFQTVDLFDANELQGLRPLLKRQDKVMLDPPRAGARAFLEILARVRPEIVLYLSCHPATQVRDIEPLLRAGYRVTDARLFDMFPQTMHMESMLRLQRA